MRAAAYEVLPSTLAIDAIRESEVSVGRINAQDREKERERERGGRGIFSCTREIHSSRKFARNTYSTGKIKGSRTDFTVTTEEEKERNVSTFYSLKNLRRCAAVQMHATEWTRYKGE